MVWQVNRTGAPGWGEGGSGFSPSPSVVVWSPLSRDENDKVAYPCPGRVRAWNRGVGAEASSIPG